MQRVVQQSSFRLYLTSKKTKKVSWRQLPSIYDSETRKTGEVWLFPVFDGEHEKKRF